MLPTMYDLPSEYPEDSGLPNEFHHFQSQLLRDTCGLSTDLADQVLIGTGLNIHYDVSNPDWHKRPDWFLVLGVEQARKQIDLRLSYLIWQEGVSPFLAVELLSPETEADDLGQPLREINQPPTKWQVYEQVLRIPYYAVFDCYENHFRLYQLVGTRYQALELLEEGYWFDELALGLRVWQGEYKGISGRWLRWQNVDNSWVLMDDERIKQAQQQTEQAQQRAEQAQQRAERLAERLRSMGVDPETL